MRSVKPAIPYTYEDYKTLPESMDKRYELLDGEIYMVPAPTVYHQRISRNLGHILVRHVREHGLGEVLYSPVDVVFGEGKDREVAQPDLIFLASPHLDRIAYTEIRGAPDLAVEILSPGTEERDRSYKKTLYARYGVREYWILDPDTRTLERYRPTPANIGEAMRFDEGDCVESPLFPGLSLSLLEVFNAR